MSLKPYYPKEITNEDILEMIRLIKQNVSRVSKKSIFDFQKEQPVFTYLVCQRLFYITKDTVHKSRYCKNSIFDLYKYSIEYRKIHKKK